MPSETVPSAVLSASAGELLIDRLLGKRGAILFGQ